jgi:hypothetical protein
MKAFYIFALSILFLTSCSSVQVHSDFEKGVDFSKYQTYAFQKSSIDRVEISDIDKRRILRALEKNLSEKGFTKSEQPQFLVSFFTKEREQVDVWQNNMAWGWGWGWGPWWGPGWGGTQVSSYTEGTLYIDIIDASTKELIWQGYGVGALNPRAKNKEERIHQFVLEILKKYPPQKSK